MYAILQHGGHQYRVAPGDRLVVERLSAEVGEVVALAPVLLVHDGDAATVGAPAVEGARVAAVVVGHHAGRKLRVFKYKAKKRYRRTQGYRSRLTELRVEALLAKGEAVPVAAGEAAPTPPGRGRGRPARGGSRRAAAAEATPPAKAAKPAGAADEVEEKPRPRQQPRGRAGKAVAAPPTAAKAKDEESGD